MQDQQRKGEDEEEVEVSQMEKYGAEMEEVKRKRLGKGELDRG